MQLAIKDLQQVKSRNNIENTRFSHCFGCLVYSAASYSRVTISVTFGYYIQLTGQAWLFLTVKSLRHSTIMGR